MIEWLAFNAQRLIIRRQFKASLGYPGNFENPKSHQEKVQFRKLYGNHAFYASVADKYRVRSYVASKIGQQHLIPLLGAYDRLHRSVFDTLPQQFIIKANHGCKWHQVVYDKSKLDIDKVVRRFNRLCKRRYGWVAGERHYNFIKPKIVIEQLLRDRGGGLPWDYNFFCYHGPNGFEYDFAIASPDGKSAKFEKNWQLRTSDIPEHELAPHVKPANFEVMVQVARDLSVDFDFVRVDLYTVEGKVYFGELTCTPHQGYGLILNKERQKIRDEMWHLDAQNPLLYNPPNRFGLRARSALTGQRLDGGERRGELLGVAGRRGFPEKPSRAVGFE
ncbi:MAG: ATP-grasp fold amidoligase family protein [Steroidobacteraceae bacterium]